MYACTQQFIIYGHDHYVVQRNVADCAQLTPQTFDIIEPVPPTQTGLMPLRLAIAKGWTRTEYPIIPIPPTVVSTNMVSVRATDPSQKASKPRFGLRIFIPAKIQDASIRADILGEVLYGNARKFSDKQTIVTCARDPVPIPPPEPGEDIAQHPIFIELNRPIPARACIILVITLTGHTLDRDSKPVPYTKDAYLLASVTSTGLFAARISDPPSTYGAKCFIPQFINTVLLDDVRERVRKHARSRDGVVRGTVLGCVPANLRPPSSLRETRGGRTVSQTNDETIFWSHQTAPEGAMPYEPLYGRVGGEPCDRVSCSCPYRGYACIRNRPEFKCDTFAYAENGGHLVFGLGHLPDMPTMLELARSPAAIAPNAATALGPRAVGAVAALCAAATAAAAAADGVLDPASMRAVIDVSSEAVAKAAMASRARVALDETTGRWHGGGTPLITDPMSRDRGYHADIDDDRDDDRDDRDDDDDDDGDHRMDQRGTTAALGSPQQTWPRHSSSMHPRAAYAMTSSLGDPIGAAGRDHHMRDAPLTISSTFHAGALNAMAASSSHAHSYAHARSHTMPVRDGTPLLPPQVPPRLPRFAPGARAPVPRSRHASADWEPDYQFVPRAWDLHGTAAGARATSAAGGGQMRTPRSEHDRGAGAVVDAKADHQGNRHDVTAHSGPNQSMAGTDPAMCTADAAVGRLYGGMVPE